MLETIAIIGFTSVSIILSVGISAYAYIKKAAINASTEQLWIKTDGEIRLKEIGLSKAREA